MTTEKHKKQKRERKTKSYTTFRAIGKRQIVTAVQKKSRERNLNNKHKNVPYSAV